MSGNRFGVPDDPQERVVAIRECEFAVNNSMKVTSMTADEVRMTMDLDGKLNGFGTGHGGAIFALADQTFGLAANLGEYPQVAVSASIRYLRPAAGILEAVSRKVREDDRTTTHVVRIYSNGELVAEFEGVGHKLKGKRN